MTDPGGSDMQARSQGEHREQVLPLWQSQGAPLPDLGSTFYEVRCKISK